MGAIAGWIGGRDAPDEAALLPALEALGHRGACGEGICAVRTECGKRAVFGQPFFDEAAGIVVAVDGAIANRAELRAQLAGRGHVFQENSAAEILARAYAHWDKDVVHHLRGAFAFALWDGAKERLMLARDRLGEKPLHLAEQGGTIYFASQVKALVAMPGFRAQADLEAVREYLEYRYVPGPRTLVRGIRKLDPGSYALWQFGRLREVRYWTSPDRNPHRRKESENPVQQFTAALEEAVQLRSPAGVLLSGGYDSAVLLALASRSQERVKTYSAGFADDRASELARAAEVAKHFGAEHHEVVLSPRDVISRLPHAVAQRDAPVSRPSDVALHFLACETARSSRAVLTGDGADELLGGYRRHVAERYGWLFRSLPTLLMLATPLAASRPRLQTAIASLRTSDWRTRYVRWVGASGLYQREEIFSGKPALAASEKLTSPFDAHPKASELRRALYFDQASWLPDHVLERTDRLTMAASLEARAPFLDHRLVEFVSTLPDELRVRGLSTKWILRQAARPLLGELAPRKGGYGFRAGPWLRGEMREFVLEHLRSQRSRTRAYYETRVLDRVLDEHLAGRRDHENLLWTLLNLEIWHRTSLPA